MLELKCRSAPVGCAQVPYIVGSGRSIEGRRKPSAN